MFTTNKGEEINGFAFGTRDVIDEFFVDFVFGPCGEEYRINVVSVIRIDGVDQATAI